MTRQDWIDRPLSEIAAGLRNGDVTATALFADAEERHRQFGDQLQAYRVWNGEHGRELALRADEAFRAGVDRGPLQGIPVSFKDLFGVQGFDTFAGSPRALPAKWEQEGPVASALSRQHAVVAGKTHMVEFAFGGVGTNNHWPVPWNPWDRSTHRMPGGSSSGAGVSIAEGSALIALGSDTAGSVRIPASVTGTVGYKSSAGRWSIEGMVPLSPTFDTPGILARSVADIVLAATAIDAAVGAPDAGEPIRPLDCSEVRIGIADDYFWGDCDPMISDTVRRAVHEIETKGSKVVDAPLPETEEANSLFRTGGLSASQLKHFLRLELPEWIATLDPKVAARVADGLELDSQEFRDRQQAFVRLAAGAQRRFDAADVIVCPTVKTSPFALDALQDLSAYGKANMTALHNTSIVNLLGLCAITLPVGLDDQGLPIGLQCIARAGADRALLSIALGFEAVLGTARQRIGVPVCVR